MPSCWQMSIFICTLTFGEKNILDLVLLTFCLTISQKEPRAAKIASQFLVFAFTNIRSSAMKIWEKLGPPDEAFTLVHYLESHKPSIWALKYSMQSRKKKRGIRGLPILLP